MKKKYEIHGWTGYDDKGKVVQTYWQKEPIATRMAGPFKLSWKVRFNPIWRLKQWLMLRRTMIYGDDAFGVKGKQK